MTACSHGLPIESRCPHCISEALGHPPCWRKYRAPSAQRCPHLTTQGPRCEGCVHYGEPGSACQVGRRA